MGRRWARVAGRCDTALGVATRPGAQQAQAGAGARRQKAQAGAWQGAAGACGARGLATGCALGALGLFSTRFNSVFFLSHIFGHCS